MSKSRRQAKESLLEGQHLLQARASASSTGLGGSGWCLPCRSPQHPLSPANCSLPSWSAQSSVPTGCGVSRWQSWQTVWLQTSHLSCLCRRANIVLTNAIVCRGSAGLGTAHHTGPVQVWQQLTQSLSSFISQNSKFSRKALSLQPLQLTRIILSTYTRDEFIPVCSNPIGSQDHLTVGNVRQKI